VAATDGPSGEWEPDRQAQSGQTPVPLPRQIVWRVTVAGGHERSTNTGCTLGFFRKALVTYHHVVGFPS
jgi:hypothetical protein